MDELLILLSQKAPHDLLLERAEALHELIQSLFANLQRKLPRTDPR